MKWLTTWLAKRRANRAKAKAERVAREKAAKRYAIHIASTNFNVHLRKGALR